jgi:hypothetical protein
MFHKLCYIRLRSAFTAYSIVIEAPNPNNNLLLYMPENSRVQFANLITLDRDSFIMGHNDRSQVLLGMKFANHLEDCFTRPVVQIPCRFIRKQ